MKELQIDPALWRGDTFEERLKRHFVDICTTERFKAFIADRRERDPSAEILGWRRRYDRYGDPLLAVCLRWKGTERQWRFPQLTAFTAPDDRRRYLVFEALLPKIGLDFGIAVHDAMFEALQAEPLAA